MKTRQSRDTEEKINKEKQRQRVHKLYPSVQSQICFICQLCTETMSLASVSFCSKKRQSQDKFIKREIQKKFLLVFLNKMNVRYRDTVNFSLVVRQLDFLKSVPGFGVRQRDAKTICIVRQLSQMIKRISAKITAHFLYKHYS